MWVWGVVVVWVWGSGVWRNGGHKGSARLVLTMPSSPDRDTCVMYMASIPDELECARFCVCILLFFAVPCRSKVRTDLPMRRHNGVI